MTERMVSLGFEDAVDRAALLPELAARLAEVRASAVSITIGRTDWVAFPWAAHPEAWSPAVRATGTDFVAAAVAQLAGGRRWTAVVDVMVEGWIGADPTIAGVSPDGERSTEFASVTALTDGVVGERIIELVETVCVRYRPDAVTLTELFLGPFTFGDDDLALFRRFWGSADWPRRASGSIDATAAPIGAWRADAVTRFVARVAAAASRHGIPLEFEARASWDGPHRDPGFDGQDYGALLAVLDRLVVWGYFALHGRTPADLEVVARNLPERSTLSVGLWARDGVISPPDLRRAVLAAEAGGATSVTVVPASFMTPSHWSALRAAWG